MENIKQRLMAAAVGIQDHLCAYSAGDGQADHDLHRCDCKFGADRIGQRSEQGNGCPEMSIVHDILDGMTVKEIREAAKRGLRKRHGRIQKKRKAIQRAS